MCYAYHKDVKIVRLQDELLPFDFTVGDGIYRKFQQWALDNVQKPSITWSGWDMYFT